MRANFKWLLLVIGLVVVTDNAISGSNANSLLSTIHQQLTQGKIVVVYQMQNDDKSSEQYADWSSYLNDFSAMHVGNYRVYETNNALNQIIDSKQFDVNESYTLFMKAGSPSYFYEGVIVEAMVYFAVDRAYTGQLLGGYKTFLPNVVTVQF